MADRNAEFYRRLPDTLPAAHSALTSRVSRRVLHWMGWRFTGEVPPIVRAVVIIAPHTSNMDFFVLCIAKFALRLKASYIMKQEAFFWPFKRWLIGIGGIPIDRSQPARVVSQISQELDRHDRIWLVITPEGTRKKVHKYKTGFVRVSHAAGVPIMVVGLDYRKKAIVFSRVVEPSSDFEAEADRLYHFCRENFAGRRPEFQ